MTDPGPLETLIRARRAWRAFVQTHPDAPEYEEQMRRLITPSDFRALAAGRLTIAAFLEHLYQKVKTS